MIVYAPFLFERLVAVLSIEFVLTLQLYLHCILGLLFLRRFSATNEKGHGLQKKLN